MNTAPQATARRTPAASPLGEAVRATCTAILAGDLTPCRYCGRYVCECQDWIEMMSNPTPLHLAGDDNQPAEPETKEIP